VGVERRDHEAGAGDGDDEVDVLRLGAGALQAALSGLAAELHGVPDVLLICFLEVAGLDGVVDGEDRVALVDLSVVDDSHHGFEAALGNVEDAAHVVLDVVASDGVLGERRGGRGDGAVRAISVLRLRWRGESGPVSDHNSPLSRPTKGSGTEAPPWPALLVVKMLPTNAVLQACLGRPAYPAASGCKLYNIPRFVGMVCLPDTAEERGRRVTRRRDWWRLRVLR